MKYGKTDTENMAEMTLQCREIVKEVLRFGVTQEQILKIIELFALELENIDHTKSIVACIKEIGSLNITQETETLTLGQINDGP